MEALLNERQKRAEQVHDRILAARDGIRANLSPDSPTWQRDAFNKLHEAHHIMGGDPFDMHMRAALAAKPAVKDDETVVALPPTREYVDRIVRIFRDRPADDTSAFVLQDYARAALSGSGSGWREPEPIKEVKALRQALLECRERAETGGRRIETAMDACEDISEIATCALPPEGWQGPAAPQQGGE